ncbi:MAG: LuxR C-terminal-related transcriptional regulator [Parashewanella sp.]
MVEENLTVTESGVPSWVLTNEEVDSIGEPFDDVYSSGEVDSESSGSLDITELALRGDIAGVQSEFSKYLMLAKKQALKNSQSKEPVERINAHSTQTKKIMLQATNLIAKKPEKTPKDILSLVLKNNEQCLDKLIQYQNIKGVRLLREVRDISELDSVVKNKLVINPSVTLTGLLTQIRKASGYVSARVVRNTKSNSYRIKKTERHRLILEYKSSGVTQKVVAEKLGISERTVKRYWNEPLG